MSTILEEAQTLPDGLWVIKWIDRFTLTRGFAMSPRVHLVLQKLRSDDVLEIENLSREVVSYDVLGRRPNQDPDDVPEWMVRRMFVGHLPLVRIGDVLRGQRIVTQLLSRSETITLKLGMEAEIVSVMAERKAPPDWPGSYRALNRFEFELGKVKEVTGANCMLIATPEAEYVIPGTVLLQTFYGFHTNVVNAFCGGQWQVRHRDVISKADFNSGLRTEIDSTTGDWYIVVETGLTRAHAVRLALLLFDPYGYECACEIHSNALEQNRGRRSDEERYWFAKPRIPYQWHETPFTMRVRGFPLRPHRPSGGARERFLVTSIDGYSWPHTDQVIHSEIANSGNRSDQTAAQKETRPYRNNQKPPPVPADPRATPDHHQDPDRNEAINQTADGTFKFLNEPKHMLQIKQSHKEYEPSRPRLQPTSSPVVSSGIESSGEGRPAPLVADTRERCPSQQLQFLLDALDGLQRDGHIDTYEHLAPPPESPLRCIRNRIPCWCFLSEEQIHWHGKRDHGWEFLFEHVESDAGVRRRSYPRCMLVLRITLMGRKIVVFEIEPRRGEPGYRTYVMEQTIDINWLGLIPVIDNIRKWSGRVEEKALAYVFESVSCKPNARRHRYARRDGDGTITGFDQGSLLRGLHEAICSPGQVSASSVSD